MDPHTLNVPEAAKVPLNVPEAATVLLRYIYSGVLGSTKGCAVDYALMNTTAETFTYSAALEPKNRFPASIDRYRITVDRQTEECSAPEKIEITEEELRVAIESATRKNFGTSSRFIDGGFSISYLVTTRDSPDLPYVVQLRHHGKVSSMDAIMKFVREKNPPDVIPVPLPIPNVYSIPGEAEHQQATGFGRQITQFVPGVMAEAVYPGMLHADKLKFVPRMALAWQACWDLPLPSPHQIGELIAREDGSETIISIGPDRHYSLGGPFTTVREWLKARIQHAVNSLDRASGIDDYKEKYLEQIKNFTRDRLDQIPESVEDIPVVALHVDMGLHNVIVSANDNTDISAIIDWEFCASAPFLAGYACLDRLFRPGAPNGFGPEFEHAEELRKAFWATIPRWKAQWDSKSAKDFMEWFRFAQFLQPQYRPSHLTEEEKEKFWEENIRVVDEMLKNHGEPRSSRQRQGLGDDG